MVRIYYTLYSIAEKDRSSDANPYPRESTVGGSRYIFANELQSGASFHVIGHEKTVFCIVINTKVAIKLQQGWYRV